jgi:hypothetical protein
MKPALDSQASVFLRAYAAGMDGTNKFCQSKEET